MWMSFVIFGLVHIFLTVPNASAQLVYPENDDCISPNRRSGRCINVKACPELLNILQQKPLTQPAIKFLQQSQCGYENRDPKVCCTSTDSSRQTKDYPFKTGISDPVDVQLHPNLRLLDRQNCGPLYLGRIINGNKTEIREFPWMALISYSNSWYPYADPEFKCGGSIINKRYILTAAHCVTSLEANLQLRGVRVGEHDLTTEKDCEGIFEPVCYKYQDFRIESIHYHKQYSPTELVNDIALIRLNRDIDLTVDNVKPICLPIGTTVEKLPDDKLIVAGFGITEQNKPSSQLIQLSLPRFPQDRCISIYKENKKRVTPKQMCYGGVLGEDSCRGDSGGPLTRPTKLNFDTKNVQYGIVSYGPKDCGKERDFPGVYTRVDQYLDWILDNLKD